MPDQAPAREPEHPLAKRNRELYQICRDARINSGWERATRENLDFWMGNHYGPAESDAKAAQGQNDPIIDRTYAGVEKLKSLLTARLPKWDIRPREGSDGRMAKVREARLEYIMDISEGQMQFKEAIHHYSATWGKGYLYAYLDKAKDWGNGEVMFTWVDTARVYVAPDTAHRYEDDAPYKILSTIYTGEQIADLFPDLATVHPETGKITGKIEAIEPFFDTDEPISGRKNTGSTTFDGSLSGRGNITGGVTIEEARKLDPSQLRYHLLERFTYTNVPFHRIMDKQSGEELILDKDQFEAFSVENEADIRAGAFDHLEIKQRRVRQITTLGQIHRSTVVLNTDIYPLVPIPNIWTGSIYTMADMSKIKDIQMLMNRLWSIILQHAQKSAKPWLLVPEGSMDLSSYEDGEEVTEYNAEFGEPHFVSPIPLASEFYRILDTLAFYIDFNLGIPELLQGFGGDVPDTASQTKLMSEHAQGRPKSKLQDIEMSFSRLGRVLDNYANAHFTAKKTLQIIQANHDREGISEGFYDDWTPTVEELEADAEIGQYDYRIKTGSTLPNDALAEYNLYRDAHREGLVPASYVVKKNPEFFDAREILKEVSEINQLNQALEQAQEEIKRLGGDLQTAQRESLQSDKRTQVAKFDAQLKGAFAELKARGNKDISSAVIALERAINELELERKSLAKTGEKKSPEK